MNESTTLLNETCGLNSSCANITVGQLIPGEEANKNILEALYQAILSWFIKLLQMLFNWLLELAKQDLRLTESQVGLLLSAAGLLLLIWRFRETLGTLKTYGLALVLVFVLLVVASMMKLI